MVENRLNTGERKELEDSLFGLPKERMFPLNDKNRVSSAIAYFRTAPSHKRKELADNINKRAKKLNMKVNVSVTNPFYRYADSDILEYPIHIIDTL